MAAALGPLTFRLGGAIAVDGRHADLLAALLVNRGTAPAESAAQKIAYELTVSPESRAEIALGAAERFELLYILDEINPYHTDDELSVLESALRGAPVDIAA